MKNLTLRRDPLGELTADELTSVVAGVSGVLCVTGICPTWECTGCHITCTC